MNRDMLVLTICAVGALFQLAKWLHILTTRTK